MQAKDKKTPPEPADGAEICGKFSLFFRFFVVLLLYGGKTRVEGAAVAIDHARLADKFFVQAVEDAARFDGTRECAERAQHDHVGGTHVARLDGEVVGGEIADAHVVAPGIAIGHRAVDEDDTAALTRGANLWKLGPFIAMRTSGTVQSGEATSFSEMMTEQFAVPPRISGP